MKIVKGRWYIAKDYEGSVLPDRYQPFRKDGPFYICKNAAGGHVWIKAADFVSEVI